MIPGLGRPLGGSGGSSPFSVVANTQGGVSAIGSVFTLDTALGLGGYAYVGQPRTTGAWYFEFGFALLGGNPQIRWAAGAGVYVPPDSGAQFQGAAYATSTGDGYIPCPAWFPPGARVGLLLNLNGSQAAIGATLNGAAPASYFVNAKAPQGYQPNVYLNSPVMNVGALAATFYGRASEHLYPTPAGYTPWDG